MKKLLLYLLLLPALVLGQDKKKMFFQLSSGSGVSNEAPTITSITVTGTTTLSGTYVYADTESDIEDEPLPIASGLDIGIRRYVGQLLTASYMFAHINGKAESGTTFEWIRSDDTSGTNATTVSTASTYTLVAGDVNKYIRFSVTPKTAALTGTKVYSPYTAQVKVFDPFVDISHWVVALNPSTANTDLGSSIWTNSGSGSDATQGATALPTWDGTEGKVRFTRTSSQSFYVPAGISFSAPATVWIKFRTPTSFTGFQGIIALSSTQNTYFSSGGTLTVGSVGTSSTLTTNTVYVLKIKIDGSSSVYSLNSGADTAVSLGSLAGTPTVRLGCWYADSNYFNGWMSEVFVSEVGTTAEEDALIKTYFGF